MTALDRIDHALGALGNILDWACAVLRPVLPPGIGRMGYRSVRQAVGLDANTGSHARGVLITSLLGETRLAPVQNSPNPRGVTGVLDEADQFRIVTSLSQAAARAGRAAIALRLEELSPIPLDEVVFAHRRISPAGVVPVQVEVSIARRSSVEVAIKHLSELDPDWRLVGALSEDGRPDLEFRRSHRQPMGLGLKAVIVAAVTACALLAWAGRLDQAVVDVQRGQVQLAAQAREAAEADRQLELVAVAHEATLTAPEIGHWMAAMSELSTQNQPFSAIRITGEAVSLEDDGVQVASLEITTSAAALLGEAGAEAAP